MASTVVTFGPGETIKIVSIPIIGDTVVEGTENLVVKLSGAVGATIAAPSAKGYIVNDD